MSIITNAPYSTIDDAHAAIVEALGEYAAEYNTEAITEEVYEWVNQTDSDGNVRLNRCGYQEKEEYADDTTSSFWDMIENYKIDQDDEEEEEPAPQLQNPFLDMLQAEVLPGQK